MDAEALKREVVRLAPWYYLWDLGPVKTDITPPCDPTGHRVIDAGPVPPRFLRGKTVLDLGCNEGAWSFAALDHGAKSAHGIDCREVNIEKARFVAEVLGYRDARFEVGSVETGLRGATSQYDFVFLCGLLYHLTDPSRTIREACDIAGEGIFVTCVLYGGEDGYTKWKESDTIASSENAADSLMPNTVFTLIDEFENNGFLPIAVSETRKGNWWGGCSLVLRSCRSIEDRCERQERKSNRFLVCTVPEETESGLVVRIVLYNRTFERQKLLGTLTVSDSAGRVVHATGPGPLSLSPRPSSEREPASSAFDESVPIDPGWGEVSLQIVLRDEKTREELAEHTLRLAVPR